MDKLNENLRPIFCTFFAGIIRIPRRYIKREKKHTHYR